VEDLLPCRPAVGLRDVHAERSEPLAKQQATRWTERVMPAASSSESDQMSGVWRRGTTRGWPGPLVKRPSLGEMWWASPETVEAVLASSSSLPPSFDRLLISGQSVIGLLTSAERGTRSYAQNRGGEVVWRDHKRNNALSVSASFYLGAAMGPTLSDVL
jgi:hypothetical protein